MGFKILSVSLMMVVILLLFGCHKEIKRPEPPKSVAPAKVVNVCNDCHDSLGDVLTDDHPSINTDGLENCLRCHAKVFAQGGKSFDFIIHIAHYSSPSENIKKDITKNCWSCHRLDENRVFSLKGVKRGLGIKIEKAMVEKQEAYFRSWADSEYLDHKHAGNNATCRSCHETYFPDSRASMGQCLLCHINYEHIAELTNGVVPNPHRSHYEDLRCTLCHKAHQSSGLYCNKCHEFELKVP